MTAMIRPVGIQYTDLCHRRVSLFIFSKIILNMLEIFKCHCKRKTLIKLTQFLFSHGSKAIKNRHISRLFIPCNQGIRLFHGYFSGIDRVNTVRTDAGKFLIRKISCNHISDCGTDHRFLILLEETDTLYGRICSLVELSRKKLYAEHSVSSRNLNGFEVVIIYRRL